MTSSHTHSRPPFPPAQAGRIGPRGTIPDRPAPTAATAEALGHAFVVPHVREVRAIRPPENPDLW
jgi:hypothetical protein